MLRDTHWRHSPLPSAKGSPQRTQTMTEDPSPATSLSAPLLEEEVWDTELSSRAASDSLPAHGDALSRLPTIESSHELVIPVREALPRGPGAGGRDDSFSGTSPQPNGMIVGARASVRTWNAVCLLALQPVLWLVLDAFAVISFAKSTPTPAQSNLRWVRQVTSKATRQLVPWAGVSAVLPRCTSKQLAMSSVQGRHGLPGGRFSTSCAAPAATAGCLCRLRMRSTCAFLCWLCGQACLVAGSTVLWMGIIAASHTS